MTIQELKDILDTVEDENLNNPVGMLINGELKLLQEITEWRDFLELNIKIEDEEGVN